MLPWECNGHLVVNGNMEGQCALKEEILLLGLGHVSRFSSGNQIRCLFCDAFSPTCALINFCLL